MTPMDSSSLRIGAWRVDPALDQISKDGNTVKLERRAMQLLLCLAEHAGQVVSVEQLLDQVWGWRRSHARFGLSRGGGAAAAAR